MSDLDQPSRPTPPLAGDETTTLLGFLEYQRSTLAWKCSGLDASGLRATLAPSSMTLGGLLKHLARVEDMWCSRWLHGNDPEPPWNAVDWDAEPEWDWHSAVEDSPEQIYGLWRDTVERSRILVAEAIADGGLDRAARLSERWDGEGWTEVVAEPGDVVTSMRWILFHLVEEYARHIGHADLLRESVDGLTGE